jgi:hypothetical protein
MGRRKLTLADQLKGVRAAIRSRRTPPQLKEGLRNRRETLRKQIRALAAKRKRSGSSGTSREVTAK